MHVFSARLEKLCQSRGITLDDLTNALDIFDIHSQQLIRGDIDIPASVLISIANYFNVSLDYLTGRSAYPLLTKE